MYSLKNEKGGEAMTEAEKNILRKFPHRTISIGVTEDGHRRSIPVPWQLGCNAYNMRTPDIWLSPAELFAEDLWAELARLRVTGMYIFCPLEDYSFLSRLTALQDLAIYKGGALENLSFLRQMPDWFLLHIEDAVLENLCDLFPAGVRPGMGSRNVCLSGCTVADPSVPEGTRLSELLILMPEGSGDRERWNAIPCSKFSYFEYRT